MELVDEAADNEQLSFLELGAGPWHHCALEVWQEALWAILLRVGHLERANPNSAQDSHYLELVPCTEQATTAHGKYPWGLNE